MLTDAELFALRSRYGRHLPVRTRGTAVCAVCQGVLAAGAVRCPDHPEEEVIVMLEDTHEREPAQSWVAIYARMRLVLATLARQVEVLDYVDPPRAAPLEETVRQLETLLAALPAALRPAASHVQGDADATPHAP